MRVLEEGPAGSVLEAAIRWEVPRFVNVSSETVPGFFFPERPWVADGRIVIHTLVTTTLAADHRVSDGHKGGLFLAEIDRLLQEPEKL